MRYKLLMTVVFVLGFGVLHAQGVVPKGDRILGMDVSDTAEGENYDTTFAIARELGVQDVGLSLDWRDIEIAPETYDTPWLEIANLYYPPYHTSVSLTIRPIHTNLKPVPADLVDITFDNPVMIERFNRLMDYVFSQIPDLQLSSLVIGSEFDIYLGTDEEQWRQWIAFCRATSEYIRSQRPDLPVAFEATFNGIMGVAAEAVQELNEFADIVGVSYYPLDNFSVQDPSVVEADFAALTAAYEGRTIYFYQLGYPSSEFLGSSEARQAEFIRETFRAWDTHADQIALIDFTWLTDSSPQGVQEVEDYYGFGGEAFRAFIGSLGLRTFGGEPKAALLALEEEANWRGW
jgi:hypothetical protein